jgi:FtsP/CotA-like multicopper oxidase with cupredoxin domain
MTRPSDPSPPELLPAGAEDLTSAGPTQELAFDDGDQVELRIAPVAKRIGHHVVRMLAYNGSVPGPTLRVRQGSELVVHVVNDGDLAATVHWHGLRLENRFDGTLLTQQAIPVGGRFTYRLAFPDPGVYWYHPHIREDYAQEMGLSGVIVVEPAEAGYWSPVHRELVLTFDDILVENGRVAPFYREHPTHTAMGRFGNLLLLNGGPELALPARPGEAVRLYLTNCANTRVFHVGLRGARMKLVGGDSGRCERERFVDAVLIAPSERVVVDALFGEPGRVEIEHRTPGRTYRLGEITVEGERAEPSLAAEFETLRIDAELAGERARLDRFLAAKPDKTLALVAEMDMGEPELPPGAALAYTCPMHPEVVRDEPGRCPACGMKLLATAVDGYACPMHPEVRSATADRCPKCGMKLVPANLIGAARQASHQHGPGHQGDQSHGHEHQHSHGHGHPEPGNDAPAAVGGEPAGFPAGIEWEDDMVEVNRLTTPANMRWKLVDRSNGAEGPAIDWTFRVGDRVKLRIVNEMDSDHPMHHPFHVHGAGRFLVVARDGVIEPNLVWKDTVLIPTGQTVDLLLEVTNPGRWMAHCHISEHHESGMMLEFGVEP